MNPSKKDSAQEIKYKVLLNIEYTFCLKIIDSVIQKASKLYEKQISTGKVIKFCCDFKLLEEKCEEYPVNYDLIFPSVSDCSGQPLGWLRNEVEQ